MSSPITIQPYEGPFTTNESEYQEGLFLSKIQQDPGVRERLAVHISTNGMYGCLDRGESLDKALDTSMFLAISNAHLLDEIAHTGDFSMTLNEAQWQKKLDAMEAGIRVDFEAGSIRKRLAAIVLRQEVSTKRYVISLSPWRKRSPTSASEII
jgi:hypothetical protein